ncbi:transcriptional regulator [Gelidibacter salicanalis]|uniref:Transcriptional regulator n=1 Tax=Gelidibacter salicanalis TaxID=291193 RepID=A0A934KQ57_9FLAO|nr:transcriptional regulator [Gelidibacter salicanalis]MBJ7881794.1 transcriptional regulator [Gelidibacter salicanalis]
MTSILTGDIIRSRSIKDSEVWLSVLKDALIACAPKTTDWDIYRGDSFQLETPNIEESLKAAIYIKACVKTIKGLDVRIAIGIGKKTFKGKTVVESNGEAFQFSGETLEQLKKEKVNLKIKTANSQLDQELNLYFKLALTIMDHWSSNSAEIVKLHIEQPHALQEELGKQLGINQNAVSSRQKRAHLDVIMQLEALYRKKITHLQI